jgi:hypothetical protein
VQHNSTQFSLPHVSTYLQIPSLPLDVIAIDWYYNHHMFAADIQLAVMPSSVGFSIIKHQQHSSVENWEHKHNSHPWIRKIPWGRGAISSGDTRLCERVCPDWLLCGWRNKDKGRLSWWAPFTNKNTQIMLADRVYSMVVSARERDSRLLYLLELYKLYI